LLPGSPAVDAGNPAGCTDPSGVLLTTDQRGFPRPSGPRCDIGAYELQPSKPLPSAARCALKAKSAKVLVRTPKGRKGKRLRKQVGKLILKIRCDQGAKLKLTGKLTEQLRKKGHHKKQRRHRKTFKLRAISKNLSAGRTITITLKLPKAALNALKRGGRESVALTLQATNSNGTSKKKLQIRRLRARRH
jgi:hypothetical protein